ncbi:MAG: alpha/beta hydrolase [Candidatus Heimdallarchaeota archaeon]|nr:alpha/beta hydrolase [Candidatus Heimdallarchaeota archaeon]
MNKLRSIIFIFIAILLVSSSSFIFWANDASGPMDEALIYLENSDKVEVKSGEWLEFHPKNVDLTRGLILYPGGKVDFRAYAPLAHLIAAEGILVIVPEMTLNLAFFSLNIAADIMESYEIETWIISGHSLGGSAASQFVYEHPSVIQNLILYSSYPSSNNDFSEKDVNVLSIYGSEDLTYDSVESSKYLLPEDTEYVLITGGTHAQFGYYGLQKGDGEPSISREEQHEQIVEVSVAFINSISI